MNFFCLFLFKCLQWVVWLFILVIAFGNKSQKQLQTMAKVEFEDPIASLTGILVASDPYYFRRYPKSGGGVMHIAQSRPNRSGHTPTPEELAARIRFGQVFGREKHQAYLERIYKNQLTINFNDYE